jgi:hypothetical protein
MPLSVGILIIGSLIWDEKRGRPGWRNNRLDATSVKTVIAPIRYGRLSGKGRGFTYTMVFSRSAGPGRAVVVACKRSVSTATDLSAEAEALWKAEQPGAGPGRIADYWGCVALLPNPNRTIPEDMLKSWADRVKREADYGTVTQTKAEGRLIDENGMLLIDWPKLHESGEFVQFDLLLATANDPEISSTKPGYPDVSQIVSAWNAAAIEHAEYFWRNTDNGIITFQDDEIRAGLRPRQQEQV